MIGECKIAAVHECIQLDGWVRICPWILIFMKNASIIKLFLFGADFYSCAIYKAMKNQVLDRLTANRRIMAACGTLRALTLLFLRPRHDDGASDLRFVLP